MEYINEVKRMQRLAGIITEAEIAAVDTGDITTKIDQSLDKVKSLPTIEKAANQIMNDSKLLQQFQQGLSKMGVSVDLMKEGEGEDISSSDIAKIVNALSQKSTQLKEGEQDELSDYEKERRANYMKTYPNAKKYPDAGQYAPVIIGAGLTSPYWLQLFSPDLLSKVGSMIGTQAAGGGLAIAGVATAIAAIASLIISSIPKYKAKKLQQESINSAIPRVKRMQRLAGLLTENEYNEAVINEEEEAESPDEKAFDAELMAAANGIAGAIGKELKSKDPKQLDEAIITSAIAAIMTSNAVVGFISKYSAKLFKLLKWKKGEDLAEKIHHWAHDNETAFQAPIKRVLGLFVKDPKTLDLISKAIYAIVVGSMAAGYSAEAVNKLNHAEWFKGALTSLKTLAKGDEAILNAYPAIKSLAV